MGMTQEERSIFAIYLQNPSIQMEEYKQIAKVVSSDDEFSDSEAEDEWDRWPD
jgi:hypothetical protein